MREVLATPHDMIRAMTGHPIVVTTADGEQVRLRLHTVDEYRVEVDRARGRLAESGVPLPPPLTEDQIRAAVRPLDI